MYQRKLFIAFLGCFAGEEHTAGLFCTYFQWVIDLLDVSYCVSPSTNTLTTDISNKKKMYIHGKIILFFTYDMDISDKYSL